MLKSMPNINKQLEPRIVTHFETSHSALLLHTLDPKFRQQKDNKGKGCFLQRTIRSSFRMQEKRSRSEDEERRAQLVGQLREEEKRLEAERVEMDRKVKEECKRELKEEEERLALVKVKEEHSREEAERLEAERTEKERKVNEEKERERKRLQEAEREEAAGLRRRGRRQRKAKERAKD